MDHDVVAFFFWFLPTLGCVSRCRSRWKRTGLHGYESLGQGQAGARSDLPDSGADALVGPLIRVGNCHSIESRDNRPSSPRSTARAYDFSTYPSPNSVLGQQYYYVTLRLLAQPRSLSMPFLLIYEIEPSTPTRPGRAARTNNWWPPG